MTGQDSSTETEARTDDHAVELTEAEAAAASTVDKRAKKKKKPRKKKLAEKVRKEKVDGVYANIILPAHEAGAFHDFRESYFLTLSHPAVQNWRHCIARAEPDR